LAAFETLFKAGLDLHWASSAFDAFDRYTKEFQCHSCQETYFCPKLEFRPEHSQPPRHQPRKNRQNPRATLLELCTIWSQLWV
jgi:hypothetical protein